MKKCYLLLIISAWMHTAVAQDTTHSKWRFHSINTMGWIVGNTKPAFQLQTVNGFRKDHVFLGLGVGTDNYKYSGVPVFADIRYYFEQTPSAAFIYGDGGIHFATINEKASFSDIRYSNGFYSDLGIGWAIGCGRHSAVELCAGWTYKRITRRESYWVHPIGTPDYEYADKYIYSLTRLVFKAGFRF